MSEDNQQTPVDEKPKSNNSAYLFFLILLIVFAGGYITLSSSNQDDIPPTSTPRPVIQQPSTVKVIYRITGSTIKADFTLENQSGNTEQGIAESAGRQFDMHPWEKTLTVERGAFVYISAQNDRDTGTIGCEIEVDGVVQEKADSTGAYAIATCSGSAGQ